MTELSWEEWSAWQSVAETELNVSEPRSHIQFQVSMDSRDVLVSPRLDSLSITYDADQIPVRDAQSWIAPFQVPIGEDVDFTYRMQVEMEGVDSGGIERIAILTQWPADVDWNAISSTGQASVDAVRSYVTDDSLVVYFSPPVGETTELTVPFTVAACSQLSTASLLSYTRPNRRTRLRRTNGRAWMR